MNMDQPSDPLLLKWSQKATVLKVLIFWMCKIIIFFFLKKRMLWLGWGSWYGWGEGTIPWINPWRLTAGVIYSGH